MTKNKFHDQKMLQANDAFLTIYKKKISASQAYMRGLRFQAQAYIVITSVKRGL
jgi:hypothetical protein